MEDNEITAHYLKQPTQYKPLTECLFKIHKGKSVGTGFHLGGGYIMTAAHCIPKGSDYLYLTKQGQNQSYAVQEEIIINRDMDFAIVKASGAEDFSKCKICYEFPKLGTEVIVAHHPRGEKLEVSTGIVSDMDNNSENLKMNDPKGQFRYTASTMKGSSGGIVALTDCSVVGVHVRGEESYQSFHSAISIHEIDQYIKKNVDKGGLRKYTSKIINVNNRHNFHNRVNLETTQPPNQYQPNNNCCK